MAAVGLLTPLVVLLGLAVVVALLPWKVVGIVFVAFAVGACIGMRERVAISSRGSRLSPAAAPELHAIVERLCIVADLAKPAIVLDHSRIPNSWIEGTTRGGFRLHLSQGLLDLLEPSELEAVVAHELTLVGGPGEALLAGGVRVAGQGWYPLVFGGAIAALIGWIGTIGTRALSRYR